MTTANDDHQDHARIGGPTDPPRLSRAVTDDVALDYDPALFEVVREDGIDLALALREDAGELRPTLRVTSATTSAPLTDAVMDVVDETLRRHPAAHLLTVDPWSSAPDDPAVVPTGRRVRFTLPVGDRSAVLVNTWVWATGRRHIRLTATYAPSRSAALAAVFTQIASGVMLSADAATLRTAATTPGSAPLDARAGARAGIPLEDLGGHGSPAASVGATYADAALAAVLAVERGGDEAHRSAAVTAGLLDPRGRLTPSGAVIADAATPARRILTARRVVTGDVRTYVAYAAGLDVVVLRVAGADEESFGTGRTTVTVLGRERLLGDVLAWLGVRPGFAFAADRTIDAPSWQAHLAGSEGAAWAQLSLAFATGSMTMALTDEGELVDVGDAGDGAIRVRPLSTAALVVRVIEGIGAAVTG